MQDWGQNATHEDQYRLTWTSDSSILSKFLDVNGDGLPDRVHHYNYKTSTRGFWVQLNTGSSFGAMENWGQNATNDYQYRPVWSDDTGIKSSFIDINGDGLPDRVHHHNYTNTKYAYWVQLNTGNGFTDFQNWGENATNENKYRTTYSGEGGIYSSYLDVNGDSLPDRVHEYNNATQEYGYWIQLNTGNSFSDMKNWGQNAPKTNKYRTIYSGGSGVYSSYLDLNGDGLPDRLHEYNNITSEYGYWVQLNQSKLPTITSVTNSKDQDIQVEYSDLRDSDIYTALTDSSYPELDVKQSAMSVVKSLKIADAIGGYSTTTFKYEGFKTHRERGSLGFSKVEILNDTRNSKTITEFHQAFPLVGISKSSETYLGTVKISDELSETSVSSYYDNTNILNLETTQNTRNKYDLNGAFLLSQVTLNSDIDMYGNIATIQTTTTDNDIQYSKITQSKYLNNEAKWILSRLEEAKVTFIGADDSRVEKSTGFTYDEDTGSLLSESIEPGSAKQLLKSYSYSTSGNLILETIDGTDIQERETSYLYDEDSKNVVKVTNAKGHSETREYDINNQVTKVTGPNGLSTTFSYDAMGKKTGELRADGTSTIT